MLYCSTCKATHVGPPPVTGLCPKCGQLLERTGAALSVTMELPAAAAAPVGAKLERPAPPPPGKPLDETAATMAFVPVEKPHEPTSPQSVRLATRKLSVNDVAMLTSAWGAAIGEGSNQRTSLKVDSKTSSGRGSSLVVNPRGVRAAQAIIPGRGQSGPGADYELLEVIGKGGMGVVYAARQASVDRMVAVKMIRPSAAADLQQREKFLSEAVVTGDLDHPNIVPIYELGTNEDDALFYSMKRVQGTPWSSVIETKELDANLEVLMKVADAVAFAHANGVIHRDLKPDNVMLGDFGEVLVMDWGLALATSSFRHGEFVTGPDSMGGTPCYMAPEMATGPFEAIGAASDIYLLGALLFEIITKVPPHDAASAHECVLAAARNEIQETNVTGELMEIALRAMATEPSDRYATVQDFQAALREYEAHCESILLANRADQELSQARTTGDYQQFAQALFGFQEALVLWDGNTRAHAGIGEARLAYAQRAMNKGDYELGISLLEADNADHAGLLADLASSKRERDARHKRLARFKRIAAAMVAIVFVVVTGSLIVVADAKNQATAAKDQAILDKIAAENAEKAAQQAKDKEKQQKELAIAAEAKAKQEEAAARAAESKARVAEEEERKQKLIAIEAEDKARSEEQKAILAKLGEEYAAYVARVGMAAAKIEENAYDTADSLLAACLPGAGETDLRQWEWGHLKRLVRHGVNFPAQGTVSSVAFAPDGKWFVTAGDDGAAHLWTVGAAKERLAIQHGSPLHAVAISPDGKLVATGGADARVRISRAADGQLVHELAGHQDRVLGLAFAPHDSRWLVSSSRDKTARVWDTTAGREIAAGPLRGHSWWVWSARFSNDAKQVVTAGQDGKAIVWTFDAAAKSPVVQQSKVFLGHEGPVFSASFSPDGRYVASAGYDKRVLVWEPARIKDTDLRQIVANQPLAAQESRDFEGHSAPVRSVEFSHDGEYLLSAADDNTVRVWEAMSGRTHAVLRGHSRPVQAAVFSPGGQQVVSVAQEGQIKLWNLLDYKQLRAAEGRVLAGHDDAVLSAAFSADGKRVVTASRDHSARVYDAATGKLLNALREGHEFLVSRAQYFQNGKRLLTAGGDSSVRIWDASTGSQLAALEGTGRNASAAIAEDGSLIFTGRLLTLPANATPAQIEAQVQLTLWTMDAKQQSLQPRQLAEASFGTGHRSAVTAVAMSLDKHWLYSGDDSGYGQLWDAESGRLVAPLRGHTGRITEACFLPDSRILLTASNDGTVAHWDVGTGRQLPLVFAHSEAGRRDAVNAPVIAMALSPDGRQVLTASEDVQRTSRQGVVRLWNIDRALPVAELYRGTEDVTSVAFAEGGKAALAAFSVRSDVDSSPAGSVIREWELPSGRELTPVAGKPLLDLRGRREMVWGVLDAAGGAGVLTVGGNGAALWDPVSPERAEVVFKPHSGVTAAAFSANGKLIVTASSDRRAKIWNAESGKSQWQLPLEHSRGLTSAAFSPVDSKLLLTSSADGTARIWELPSRRVLQVLQHGDGEARNRLVHAATFAPDGKHVATAGEDATVRFWDVASGEAAGELKLDAPVLAIGYSADGRRLLAGCSDGRAVLFDCASHQPLVRYLGHTAAINAVALSPDGQRALTGSSDRLAKLWDTANDAAGAEPSEAPVGQAKVGKEILSLKHHEQAVTAVAFSPDGRTILTAGLDGNAMLWLSEDWHKADE